jgi:hypothetical protein
LAAQAKGPGWHLATITSAAENAFVFDLVDNNPDFWNCCFSGNSQGPWLGGFKSGSNVGDYSWVTGEPFVYTNWGPLEPFGNGDRMSLFGYQGPLGPYWNDAPDTFPTLGYVAENSSPVAPIPEPSTIGLALLGFVAIGMIRKGHG